MCRVAQKHSRRGLRSEKGSKQPCEICILVCDTSSRWQYAWVSVGHVSAADTDADTDAEGRLYQPSANPVANVQRALDRAGADNRLALAVLGI